MPTKALAALGGGGLAGALVTIIIAFTGTPSKGGVPPDVFVGALVTLASSLLAAVSAYVVRMEGGA